MKKLLLIRYGAYGDIIYMSSLLPYLLEQYEITLETNIRGYHLFKDDPRFTNVRCIDPFAIPEEKRVDVVRRYWDLLPELQPDFEILNLIGTLELSCVCNEIVPDATLPTKERARKYGANFYENHFKRAKIPFPGDFTAENHIFFTNHEKEVVGRWALKNKDTFTMIVVLGGSTIQKVFPTWMKEYCEWVIDNHPKATIYLLGDKDCADEVWTYERTVSYVHGTNGFNLPFKQALLMAKHADYVIGGETGLLVGAGHWGTPKTMLSTTSAMDQTVKYHRNDHSLQSSAECSPCYRSCYTPTHCKLDPVYNTFPICTHEWDMAKLKGIINGLYETKMLYM